MKISQTIDYQYVDSIVNDSLRLISHCLDLAGADWRIDYNDTDENSFSAIISSVRGGGDDILGVVLLPDDKSITCDGVPTTFPFRVTNVTDHELNLQCKRVHLDQVINGIQVKTAPKVNVVVKMNGNTQNFEIPEYYSSLWTTIPDKISSAIGGFAYKLSSWPAGEPLKGVDVSSDTDKNPAETDCPTGSYATGVRIISGGKQMVYCQNCVVDVQVVCRPLNTKLQ